MTILVDKSLELKPTVNTDAGGGIYNGGKDKKGSAALKVKKYDSIFFDNTPEIGFLTHGHDVKINDTIINMTGETIGTYTIGTVKARCAGLYLIYDPDNGWQTREADASYVKLASGHTFTNILPNGETPASESAVEIVQGLPVCLKGRLSTSNGTVTIAQRLYANYGPDRMDGLVHYYIGAHASYSSLEGDSGGIVYALNDEGNWAWAGVQSGGGEDYTYSQFAIAGDVISSIYVLTY